MNDNLKNIDNEFDKIKSSEYIILSVSRDDFELVKDSVKDIRAKVDLMKQGMYLEAWYPTVGECLEKITEALEKIVKS